MNLPEDNGKLKALILSMDGEGISRTINTLTGRGIEAEAVNSLEQFIDVAGKLTPNLVIVEDDTRTNCGILAIRHALGISWMVSSILVSPLGEDEIHERAEALGILGSMSSLDDTKKLNELLDSFDRLRPQ